MYLCSFPLSSSSFICFQSIPKQNKSIHRPYEVNFFCNVRLIHNLAPAYLFAILSNFCLVWIICLTEHILDFQDSLLLLHSCLWSYSASLSCLNTHFLYSIFRGCGYWILFKKDPSPPAFSMTLLKILSLVPSVHTLI